VIKANVKFEEKIFEKRTEMRKILYVHIRETNTNFSIPLMIYISQNPNNAIDSIFKGDNT